MSCTMPFWDLIARYVFEFNILPAPLLSIDLPSLFVK